MTRRVAARRKLKYAGVPLLAEVKHVDNWRDPGFLSDVVQRLLLAQSDVMDQAHYLFRNYPRQDSTILVACSGIWWTCQVVHRDQFGDLFRPLPRFLDDSDDESVDAGEPDVNEDDDEVNASDDELDIIDAPEGEAFGESEATLPKDRFSRVLQLGTQASNRRFGLIHQRLEATLANRTGNIG